MEYESDLTYTFPSEDGREEPTDPNADLIGRQFMQEGRLYTITHTASWSKSYVVGQSTDQLKGFPTFETCFVAAYLRP